MYLTRHLAIPLHRAVAAGESVLVMGPRGAGKSTLLRKEFPGHLYVDLSDGVTRREARTDPVRFLLSLRREAILDEVQRVPELATSLATRAPLIFASSIRLASALRTFELHPPTRAERERRAALPLDVLGRFEARPNLHAASIPWEWRKDYLDKDLPLLFKVEDRDHFESFATALESRSAQVLNLQETARDVAISHRTAVRWLTALETCFQILLLRPLDDSLGRRQIQAPKLHSWTSLHFETQTVAELYRNAQHSAAGASFRYWRDSNGFEIPLVLVESSGRRLPVGIAPEAAPGQEASLERWLTLANEHHAALISRAAPLAPLKKNRVLRYWLSQL